MYTSAKHIRARQGLEAKSKALAIAMRRKEEYLGARVPKELKETVMARAAELGISVSILMRNVLEEAFGVNGIQKNVRSSRVGSRIGKNNAGAVAVNKFPMVLGWDDIKLNRPMACADCGKRLEPGSYVTFGITAPGEERIILCEICKESL